MSLSSFTHMLSESWVHLWVALEPTARPSESSRPAPTVRPWSVGATVVERASGQPRMVIGYKPDGRCMTVYVTPLPWMQRSSTPRIFVDEVDELSSIAELKSVHEHPSPAEEVA